MTTRLDRLLAGARAGNKSDFDDLFERLYEVLRAIAHQRLARHRPGETIDTTALVHEAYLKLVDQSRASFVDRAHFLALASRAMRFVLVDYARSRGARKRGGDQEVIPFEAVEIAADERATDLLALHDALDGLAGQDERLSSVVEYRFFGGMTFDEIAAVCGRSVPTVKRDWTRARLWLHRAMSVETA